MKNAKKKSKREKKCTENSELKKNKIIKKKKNFERIERQKITKARKKEKIKRNITQSCVCYVVCACVCVVCHLYKLKKFIIR